MIMNNRGEVSKFDAQIDLCRSKMVQINFNLMGTDRHIAQNTGLVDS